MNKIIKAAISIVMSFAIAVCLVPTWAGAEEVSVNEDDGISPATIGMGNEYQVLDKWGKISAMFVEKERLRVTYTDLTNTSRYIKIYLSEAGEEFPVKTLVVKANKSGSVLYNINYSNYSNIIITIYRHTSTSPNSGQIDPIVGRVPN